MTDNTLPQQYIDFLVLIQTNASRYGNPTREIRDDVKRCVDFEIALCKPERQVQYDNPIFENYPGPNEDLVLTELYYRQFIQGLMLSVFQRLRQKRLLDFDRLKATIKMDTKDFLDKKTCSAAIVARLCTFEVLAHEERMKRKSGRTNVPHEIWRLAPTRQAVYFQGAMIVRHCSHLETECVFLEIRESGLLGGVNSPAYERWSRKYFGWKFNKDMNFGAVTPTTTLAITGNTFGYLLPNGLEGFTDARVQRLIDLTLLYMQRLEELYKGYFDPE